MPRRFTPSEASFRAPYADAQHRRMPYNGRDDRRFHRREFGWGGAPFWGGWVSPYLPSYFDYPGYGYGDDWGDDDSQADAAPAGGGYGNSPYDQGAADPSYGSQPYGPPAYPPQQYAPQQYAPQPYAPQQAPPPAAPVASNNENPVTVVFKDGRPPEQIHNYLLTSTTLSVLDPHHHDIPVDQIDLVATAKVNHDAGVDFLPPPSSR